MSVYICFDYVPIACIICVNICTMIEGLRVELLWLTELPSLNKVYLFILFIYLSLRSNLHAYVNIMKKFIPVV